MATPGGRIAPTKIIGWLTQEAALPCYVGLVTADPFGTSDPLSVEILGDAYRRPQFGYELVGTILRNSLPLHWAGIPALTRVAGIAGFGSLYGSDLSWYTPFPDPMDFPAGGNLDFPAREVFIGIDT